MFYNGGILIDDFKEIGSILLDWANDILTIIINIPFYLYDFALIATHKYKTINDLNLRQKKILFFFFHPRDKRTKESLRKALFE